MGKKIVFTIVAKNYLPLARALGWSLKNNNSTDVDFIIFLADGDAVAESGETIVPITSLGLENLDDLAFKYSITEFCTSVKPTCFKYIFQDSEVENAIYFDPDIFVFNDLKSIYTDLILKDIVVTPHYHTKQSEHTGDQSDMITLFVGIYNFGFVAFNNSKANISILDWWEDRLTNQCYADKQDALHTDQKWADFFPVYAGDRLHISPSRGYNFAPWNIFEREVSIVNDKFIVTDRFTGKSEPLTFVHFAGYAPESPELIHKDFWDMGIEKYPEYTLVRDIYDKITAKYEFMEKKKLPYLYAEYTNGVYIHDYHRRLYRALTDSGKVISNPFSSEGWFFQLLLKKKMITESRPAKQNSKTLNNFDGKLSKINKMLKILFKVLGTDKYFLFLKFLNRYTRPENQLFLLDEKRTKIY